MDNELVTGLGGAIGSYFDKSNENRQIARELGGIELLIQNIRNNFHGQYSDWAYEPVKQSLFGLSSGTWTNQDVAARMQIVPLHVQLMKEHGNETKIGEETLQAVKAMLYGRDSFRWNYTNAGIFEALVGVLRGNPTDRGAISLSCESIVCLVGVTFMFGPTLRLPRLLAFDPAIQAKATEAGILEALIETATSNRELEHFEHNFNFDVDSSYNAKATCYQALHVMAKDNMENRAGILEAKVPERIEENWAELDHQGQVEACGLFSELGLQKSKCP
ncbi:Hypothetical protein SCF082_LOCUS37836 [Durusdinium trenchii]